MREPRAIAVFALCGIALLRQGSPGSAYATGAEVFLLPAQSHGETAKTESDPWTDSQIQQPADLAKVLLDPKSKKPVIVCVGFEFLYRNAHIPGALFHGPGRNAQGLENLKKWAETIPRNQSILLYCGCCPWKHCPNIRPAFQALHEMGFTGLKVLFLERDFARDWLEKGFPIEKGK